MAHMTIAGTGGTQQPINPFIKENSRFYRTNPFDVLPAELNNQIRQLALQYDKPFIFAEVPALLFASKTDFFAGAGMFFTNNAFAIDTHHLRGKPCAEWVADIEAKAKRIGFNYTSKVSTLYIDLGVVTGTRQQSGNESGLINWNRVLSLRKFFAEDVDLVMVIWAYVPSGGYYPLAFRAGHARESWEVYLDWRVSPEMGMELEFGDFDSADMKISRLIDSMRWA